MTSNRIYHIHSDSKFIADSKRFNDEFINIIIYISIDKSKTIQNALNFDVENKGFIDEIIEEIIDADLIVLYGLCDIKKEIIRKNRTNAKILWRYFGYELYGKRKDLMFSKETYNLVERAPFFLDLIRKFKRKIINYHHHKIVKKIDYILLFSEEEYVFLKKHWSVPKFLQMNIQWVDKNEYNSEKKQQIIFGNSQSPYNNHLEVLKIFKESLDINYNIIMFFSYGAGENYRNLIKEHALELRNVELIEDFLSIEDFNKYYEESAAIVINSYRQFALGNIFTAFRMGVKVYLNSKNVTIDWLKNEGFLVYTIEGDLKKDLRTNNLVLTSSQMEFNKNQVLNLQSKITSEEFNQQILRLLHD